MTTTDNTSIKAPHEAILDLPQERITGDILRGRGPRRGNLERLIKYWRPIMRKPGGFRRCLVILADHPELYPLERICAWLHHETTGLWPNEGNHHAGGKLGPIVKRTVKKKRRRRRGKNLEIIGGVDFPVDRVERRLDRMAGSTRFKMLDGSEGQLQYKSSRVTRVGRAVESVLLPGERGALKPRHLLRTALTPGGSGAPGPKLSVSPRSAIARGTKKTRGFRCPPGFERGGHYTDSRMSTCGHQLFGVPGSTRSTIGTIAAAANRQPGAKAEIAPEPKEAAGAAPASGIGGGMPTLPEAVGRPNEELQMEHLGKLIESMGAVKNPTDKPIRRMVREDGSILQPMAPLDILAKQKDNPDMKNAAFLTKVDGPGPIGSDELPLMPIGLRSLDYALPGGGRVSLKRTGGLMPPGKARAFGKAVAAARREPADEMNYADLFQKIAEKTDAVTLEIDTPGEGDSNKVVMVKGPDGEKKVPYWVYEIFLAGDAPGKEPEAAPYTMVGEVPAEAPAEKPVEEKASQSWGPLQYTAALIPDYDEIDHTIGVTFKASAYRAYQRDITWAFIEEKRASSVWDRGMERFRCPPGSVNGGQITNRLGIGCGAAVLERVGRLFGQAADVADNVPTPGRARAQVTPNRPGRRRDRVPGDAHIGPVDITPDMQDRIVNAIQGEEAVSVLAPDERRSRGGVRGRIADMLDTFALNVDAPADELEDAVLQSRRARDLDAEEAERVAAEAAAAQRAVAQREAQARRAQEAANRIQEETERIAREAQLEDERNAIEQARNQQGEAEDAVRTVGDPVDFDSELLYTGFQGTAQLREHEGEYFIDVDMRDQNGQSVVDDPEGPFASRAEAIDYIESMTGNLFVDPDVTPDVTPDATPDVPLASQPENVSRIYGIDDAAQEHIANLYQAGDREGLMEARDRQQRSLDAAERLLGDAEAGTRNNVIVGRRGGGPGDRDARDARRTELRTEVRRRRELVAQAQNGLNILDGRAQSPEPGFTGGRPPRPADAPRVRTARSNPFRDRDNSLPSPGIPSGVIVEVGDLSVDERSRLDTSVREYRRDVLSFWSSRVGIGPSATDIDDYVRGQLQNPDILPGHRNTLLRRREDWAHFQSLDDDADLVEVPNRIGGSVGRRIFDRAGIPVGRERRRRGRNQAGEHLTTDTPGNGLSTATPDSPEVVSTATDAPWTPSPALRQRRMVADLTYTDVLENGRARFSNENNDRVAPYRATLTARERVDYEVNRFANGLVDNPEDLLAAIADANDIHAESLAYVGDVLGVRVDVNDSGLSSRAALPSVASLIPGRDEEAGSRALHVMEDYAQTLEAANTALQNRGVNTSENGPISRILYNGEIISRTHRTIERELAGVIDRRSRINAPSAPGASGRRYEARSPALTQHLWSIGEAGDGLEINRDGIAEIYGGLRPGEFGVVPGLNAPGLPNGDLEVMYEISGNALTIHSRDKNDHSKNGFVRLYVNRHMESDGTFQGRTFINASYADTTPNFRNQGVNEATTMRLAYQAMSSGSVAEVHTSANMTIGVYAWASLGFDFTDGRTPNYVKLNSRAISTWLKNPTDPTARAEAEELLYDAVGVSVNGSPNPTDVANVLASYLAHKDDVVWTDKDGTTHTLTEALDKIASESYTEANAIAKVGKALEYPTVGNHRKPFNPGKAIFIGMRGAWPGIIRVPIEQHQERIADSLVDPTA